MRALLTTLCLIAGIAISGGLNAQTPPMEAHQDSTSVTSLRPGRQLTVG